MYVKRDFLFPRKKVCGECGGEKSPQAKTCRKCLNHVRVENYMRPRVALRLRELGWTFREVGDAWGVSRERARQMVAKGARVGRQGCVGES